MKLLVGILKWVLVIVSGLVAALLAVIFLSDQSTMNSFLLRLVILVLAGFSGGLAGRVLLRKIPAFPGVLLVIVSNLIALIVFDFFYETPYELDFMLEGFNFTVPTISDGSQILLMNLVSLLPMLILRRKHKKSEERPARSTQRRGISLSDSIKPVLYRINPQNWQIFHPKSKSKRWKSTSKSKVKAKAKSKPKVSTQTATEPKLTVSRPSKSIQKTKIGSGNGRKPARVKPSARKLRIPGWSSSQNANDVKLVGDEEHVCPYCLEEVVRSDKNGVVICPECGTWHHQDCWNLTGSCGVAHRNQL